MINYITDQGGQRFPLAPKYVGTLSIPNNVIQYEAPTKLTETTSYNSGGLHTNKFGTTMVSHTFVDGVGTIEFEDDVTTFDSYAFYNCSGLISVTIPNSVTSIGTSTFSGCRSLTNIIIPNNVTSIGGGAFDTCSNLTSIVVDSDNTIYDSRENCNAIIETASNLLIRGCENTVIPNSVTSIRMGAFTACVNLTSITIPNSVTSIGDGAFAACGSLTSIIIPDSVTSIGASTFAACSSLTNVTIPNSITSIGD